MKAAQVFRWIGIGLIGLPLLAIVSLGVAVFIDTRTPREAATSEPEFLAVPTPMPPAMEVSSEVALPPQAAPTTLEGPTSIMLPAEADEVPLQRTTAKPFMSKNNQAAAQQQIIQSQEINAQALAIRNQPPVPIILEPGSDRPGSRLNRSRVNESFNERSPLRNDLRNRSPHSFHSVQVAPEQNPRVVGNVNTGVYHDPSCSWASKIAYKNRKMFASALLAQEAGLRPCQVCGG